MVLSLFLPFPLSSIPQPPPLRELADNAKVAWAFEGEETRWTYFDLASVSATFYFVNPQVGAPTLPAVPPAVVPYKPGVSGVCAP